MKLLNYDDLAPEIVQPDTLIFGDCLEVMPHIPDYSVDTIIADPPYGVTFATWDKLIPFDLIWKQINRILKPQGTILIFASQPFTTQIIISNQENFRFCWYWKKEQGTNFLNAHSQPLRAIEEICVFYKNKHTYNPQMIELDEPYTAPLPIKKSDLENTSFASAQRESSAPREYRTYTHKHPTNILTFGRDKGKRAAIPTQKPVGLIEYLIRTHSNEGEVILDPTMGSGTCGVACRNTNRKFIGIEKNQKHYDIAVRRVSDA